MENYVLDLPEEIALSNGHDLEVTKKGDSILIQFKTAHACTLVDCEMTGARQFTSQYEEGSDGYLFDLTHYNHPAWTYEECENFVFGYGEYINKNFDVPDQP